MATKSYSKHKEYKEYSSSGNIPYTDEQFDMIKSDLIPRGSKLETFNNGGPGSREYHYEYKEEKHPSGKYDRKDLHTVEEYTIPPKTTPKSSESSTYYYQREERDLPAITSGTRTYNYETSVNSTPVRYRSMPGYSKVKSSKVTKELAHNVDELDSLLDDLQKDQERQLYKGGYTSDTAESTSFDYKRGTPAKAPSSGYSTLKREEVVESSSWGTSPLAPPPAPVARSTELRQEMFREETTESRVVPAPAPASPQSCTHCHHVAGTLTRSTTPMNKVTTTVKTYTYEVPAGQEPSTLPLPAVADHQHTYVTTAEELRSTNSSTVKPSPSPGGCQHCAHCNARVRDVRVTDLDRRVTDLSETRVSDRSQRVVHPAPANDVTLPDQLDGHPPHGPSSYKYTETSYSSHNSTQRFPGSPPPNTHLSPSPSPRPAHVHLSPSPAPFPRPTTPSPGNQQTPKKLDDLLADFPEARFPTQPDGAYRRKVEVTESASNSGGRASNTASKNVAGPAVYYPPGHTPFATKPETQLAAYQQSSAMQGGGAYASGRGMYEYESGSKSKEKHSERKTAVPICLPLCCAMPCVIM